MTRQCFHPSCSVSFTHPPIRVSEGLVNEKGHPTGTKYMRLFCSQMCAARWLVEQTNEVVPLVPADVTTEIDQARGERDSEVMRSHPSWRAPVIPIRSGLETWSVGRGDG